jgi:hypothetical protein
MVVPSSIPSISSFVTNHKMVQKLKPGTYKHIQTE